MMAVIAPTDPRAAEQPQAIPRNPVVTQAEVTADTVPMTCDPTGENVSSGAHYNQATIFQKWAERFAQEQLDRTFALELEQSFAAQVEPLVLLQI